VPYQHAEAHAGWHARPFAHSLAEWATGAAIGPIPGWAVVLATSAFYCWIIYTALRRYAGEGEPSIGDVHV
jgi:uncharacterized membrane protein